MAKANDITGVFRVPEAGWGRFWNFMRTMPGADITPDVRTPNGDAAQAMHATVLHNKRTKGSLAGGTSLKCVVLNNLLLDPESAIDTQQISAMVVEAGFAKSSTSNVLFELKRDKLIKRVKKGYALTVAGEKFRNTKCSTK